MVALFYFILVCLLLVNRRSSILSSLTFVLLLILFAFNSGIADRENYEMTLRYIDNTAIEPGYAMIYGFLALKGLDIQWIYIICAPLLLLTLFLFVRKYSCRPNYVLAIYMLSLFFLDVVQNRFSFASIFVYWGFYFLLREDTLKHTLLFVTSVLIASMFHSSSLAFLFFLFIKYLTIKELYLFVAIISVSAITITNLVSTFVGDILGISDYVERLLSSDNYAGSSFVLICSILVLLTFIMYTISSKYHIAQRDDNIRLRILGKKISIISIVFIPLMSISADFRRLFFIIFIILIIISSNWILDVKSKLPVVLQMVITTLLLYYFSFAGENFHSVINPIFTNNLLFNSL